MVRLWSSFSPLTRIYISSALSLIHPIHLPPFTQHLNPKPSIIHLTPLQLWFSFISVLLSITSHPIHHSLTPDDHPSTSTSPPQSVFFSTSQPHQPPTPKTTLPSPSVECWFRSIPSFQSSRPSPKHPYRRWSRRRGLLTWSLDECKEWLTQAVYESYIVSWVEGTSLIVKVSSSIGCRAMYVPTYLPYLTTLEVWERGGRPLLTNRSVEFNSAFRKPTLLSLSPLSPIILNLS